MLLSHDQEMRLAAVWRDKSPVLSTASMAVICGYLRTDDMLMSLPPQMRGIFRVSGPAS